ncbi:MAG: hypothetical protein ACKOW9_03235 [Candidatus Paceibacterota bacterium]
MNKARILIGLPNPEGLNIIVNGDFINGSESWNITPSNTWYYNNGRMYSLFTSGGTVYQSGITTTVGTSYKVRYYVHTTNIGLTTSFGGQSFNISGAGWKEHIITATGSTNTLQFTKLSGFTGFIDGVTITKNGGYTPYNYEEIDITDDSFVTLNMARQDVETLGKRNTTFSKTIDVPSTVNNDKIFNNLFDLSVTNTDKYLNEKLKCLVYFGDAEVLNGEAELTAINVNHGLNEAKYSLVLRDTIKGFADLMGEKYIVGNPDLSDDIDFSEYNHTYTASTVLNSWSSNFSATSPTIPYGYGYFYPLLNTTGTQTQDFDWVNFRPAIYAKELFDKIITGAGYTYTSTFLNSNNFKQLAIPFTGQIELDENELFQRTCKVGLTDDHAKIVSGKINSETYSRYVTRKNGKPLTYGMAYNNTNTGYFGNESSFDFYDPNNNWGAVLGSARYGFTVPTSGSYKFNFKTECLFSLIDSSLANGAYIPQNASVNITVNLRLFRGGTNKVIATNTITKQIVGTVIHTTSNGFSVVKTYPMDLLTVSMTDPQDFQTGDIITPEVTLNAGNLNFVSAGGVPVDFYCFISMLKTSQYDSTLPGTFFSVEAFSTDKLFLGDKVIMNKFLPKGVKQYDYVANILSMFNLVVDVDNNDPNKLIIDTRNNYLSGGTSHDWSLLLNREQDLTIERVPTLIGKNVEFTYLEDTDDLNVVYQNAFEKTYGDYTVFNEDTTVDNYTISLDVFSPTPCSPIPTTNIVIGQLYETDKNSKKVSKQHNLRILYRNDIIKNSSSNITTTDTTGNNNFINIIDAFTGAKTTVSTWFTTVTQFDEPYKPNLDLNWGFSNSYWNTFYNNNGLPPYGNLYDTYWKDYIDSIISPDAKLVTGYFKLYEDEIYKFKFNDQVNIDGNGYLVNKIVDWNPDKLTEVQLIKILESKIPITPSGKTSSTLTLVNISNWQNYSQKISTHQQWSAMPSPPVNGYPVPLSYPSASLSSSGDTIENYSAVTENIEVVPPSVVADNSLGYLSGNDNFVNSTNFFMAGWSNKMDSATTNILTIGNNNTFEGYNNNVSILSSNAIIAPNVNDVAVIGTSLSGVTVNQSNTTVIAGNTIFSTKPIQPIINLIISGDIDVIQPMNRFKNIHIVNGNGDSFDSLRSVLGSPNDIIHVINPNVSPNNTFSDNGDIDKLNL